MFVKDNDQPVRTSVSLSLYVSVFFSHCLSVTYRLLETKSKHTHPAATVSAPPPQLSCAITGSRSRYQWRRKIMANHHSLVPSSSQTA